MAKEIGMLGLTLLPSGSGLEIEQISGKDPEQVTGVLTSVWATSLCPGCGIESGRVQSHYCRKVADLPWATIAVLLILQVRRFYWDNPACKRNIFCERLPAVVQPYRRRTVRMEKALQKIAYAEGGESGARTASSLGMPISPDTMLRQIRRAAASTGATPRVLGIDEFSFRRGQRYGTILIDLEKHQRVDVLPDRNAESVANWLQAHPGVEIISRDRGQIYADGGRQGAPNAEHVADRFHLVENVRDAIERLLNSHHKQLKAAAEAIAAQTAPQTAPTHPALETVSENPEAKVHANQNAAKEQTSDELPSGLEGSVEHAVSEIAKDGSKIGDENKAITWRERSKQLSAERRQRRLARYQQIRELSQQGMSGRAIARQLELDKDTVMKFLKADLFPERAEPKRYSIIDRFISYLRQRWDAGIRNSSTLWEEIKERGFTGSLSRVKEFLVEWRKQLPLYLQGKQGRLTNAQAAVTVPSPRQVAFWLLGISKEKKEETKLQHQNYVETLCNICDEARKARELGVEFREMINKRQADKLDDWLEKAKASGLPDLKNFASGIGRDKDAVLNALRFEWSNGQVEGNNNRLKLIKRQMYGRAKFDLLRARVLHPT